MKMGAEVQKSGRKFQALLPAEGTKSGLHGRVREIIVEEGFGAQIQPPEPKGLAAFWVFTISSRTKDISASRSSFVT